MRNLKWKIAATASVAALAVVGLAGFSGIAGADPALRTSKTAVDGLDVVTDDFGDHAAELGAPLSDHGPNSWGTDTVILWQAILAADGFLPATGIDGYFGEDTATATEAWQIEHGVGDADKPGTVGHTTWAKADDGLIADDGTVDYRSATGGVVVFERAEAPDGHYTLLSVTDADEQAMVNQGGDTIEHFKLTIELVPDE